MDTSSPSSGSLTIATEPRRVGFRNIKEEARARARALHAAAHQLPQPESSIEVEGIVQPRSLKDEGESCNIGSKVVQTLDKKESESKPAGPREIDLNLPPVEYESKENEA